MCQWCMNGSTSKNSMYYHVCYWVLNKIFKQSINHSKIITEAARRTGWGNSEFPNNPITIQVSQVVKSGNYLEILKLICALLFLTFLIFLTIQLIIIDMLPILKNHTFSHNANYPKYSWYSLLLQWIS